LRWIHGADVLWAAAITLFTEGPSSPFFLFFVFVVVAAAYRWGFRETSFTAAITVVFLLAETALVGTGLVASQFLPEESFDLTRVVMRAIYLMLMGFLLGILGEEEKRLRREHEIVARAMARAGSQVGVWETLRSVLSEFICAFVARGAVVCFEHVETGRGFVWEARTSPDDPDLGLHTFELEPSEREIYFFESPEGFWCWRTSSSPTGALRSISIDERGLRLREPEPAVPDGFQALHPNRSLMAVSFRFRDDWRGRLFLVDPKVAMPRERGVRLLRTLVEQVGPTVHSVYLTSCLRAQARALERSRVAAEIHDGAIQSLIAVELEIEALRRRMGDANGVAKDLAGLKGQVRKEVLELRDLMRSLRSIEVDSYGLPDYLRDAVEQFHRETGIEARFHSEPSEVRLSPRVCREIVHILREALVNVRKHSGAKNVLVRFGAEDGGYTLVIDDDGKGFPFSGRWSQENLTANRRGPAVIRERVRAIGAEMTIESTPDSGSRLEIKVPRNNA
jgi:signal transduction histidine kinase